MDTDTKSPQKIMDEITQSEDSIVPNKHSIVSPIKDGKSVLGFQGFKLLNSSKILLKTSLIKIKSTMQQPKEDNCSAHDQVKSPTKKLGTADAIKQLREKFGAQTHSLISSNPDRDSSINAINGVDETTSKQISLKISSTNEHRKSVSKSANENCVTEKTVSDRRERYRSSNSSSSNTHSHKQSASRKSKGRSRSPRRDSGSSRGSFSRDSYRRSSFARNKSTERTRHSHSAYHKEREYGVSKSRSRSDYRSIKRRASDGDEEHYDRSPNRNKYSARHYDKPLRKSDTHVDKISSNSLNCDNNGDTDTENISSKAKEEAEKHCENEIIASFPQTSSSEEYAVKSECNTSQGGDTTEDQDDGLFSKFSSTLAEFNMEVNGNDGKVVVENSPSNDAANIENIIIEKSDENDMTEATNVMKELKQTDPPLCASPQMKDSKHVGDENETKVDSAERTSINILHQCTNIIDEKTELDTDDILIPSPSSDKLHSETPDMVVSPRISSTCAETPIVEHNEEEEAILCIPTSDSIKTENKIPALASKLKNVFESILQTDFNEATTVENITDMTKVNGMLQNITESDCSNQDNNEEHLPIEDRADKNLIINDTLTNHVAESAFSETEQDDNHPASQELVTNHTTSPDKLCRVSPHSNKLKLHATTNTPLPAKKSYIKQVQNDSEAAPDGTIENLTSSISSHSVNSELSSITPCLSTTTDMSDAVGMDVKLSSSNSPEHSVSPDIVTSNKIDSDPVDEIFTDLQRQDSSGSSTNDNDDGPRRSARIRTKKTEKSLHKIMIKSSQNTSERQPENSPGMNQTSENATDSCPIVRKHNEIERTISNDMSKEDIFKARINVARDVTGCPDLFDLLDENLYLSAKKKSRARKEIRRMVCDCALEETADPDGPCGGNCLNRLLMIECSSRCHFGDRCTNKRFQQRIYAPTEVFETSYKGWGIRAASDIGPGQLVMEYCGEVVDQRGFTKRSLEYSKSNHAHFYFMALSQDEVIDATYKGNSSRFINHSCDPNAETQKWTVNGRLRVGFFTLRDIGKGEEITFDYQFERYGKVAQKCFCGTEKCRGYLGKAPDAEKDAKLSKLLSNDALSPDEDEISGGESDSQNNTDEGHKNKKKKMALFRDDTIEKDISKLLGGLRSSKEVLALSRLMVRCDTHSERVLCLRVLKETTSQTRLKTFLQFHGLSIIWSWMVDVSGTEDDEAHILKLDIINTLCMLPITNRNVIEDSKVLSVVQRWAKQENEGKLSPETETDAKDAETKETVNGTNETDTEKVDDSKCSETAEVEDKVPTPTEVAVENESEDTDKTTEKASPSDVEKVESTDNPVDTDEPEAQRNEQVVTAAASLLDSWKDLREIYRIPKRQKPLNSPEPERHSRDNSSSRTSSPLPKHSRNDDYDNRGHRTHRSRRNSSQERWRDSFDRSLDNDRHRYRDRRSDYSDNRYSPGSSHSNENRGEAGRRKRRFSTDSDEYSQGGKNVPWHCRPPRSSRFESRMSRQEYRKRFEKETQKREQEKKRRVEERDESDRTPNNLFPMNSMGLANGYEEVIPPLMGQDINMMGQNMADEATTFTSSGYSGNLIQINPTQPQLIQDPYMNMAVNQQMGVVNQVLQPQTQNAYGVQMPVQQTFNMNTVYSQDPNVQMGMSTGYVDPNMQLATVGQQLLYNSVTMMQQQPVLQQQNIAQQQQSLAQQQQTLAQQQQTLAQQQTIVQQQQTIPQQQQQSSNVTILGSQNGQAIVLLTAEQLQKLTQGNLDLQQPQQQPQQPLQQPQQPQAEPSQAKPVKKHVSSTNKKQSSTSESSKPESSKKSTSDKLPPNWKTATDAEGRIYYYHVITRQTQWDAPTWDGNEEDMVGKKEAEMDLSSTPTYDERLRKTSKVKSEKITEEGRKAKEAFRLKMSQFIVQCLSQFRKSDKKVGRITSTEDFKHLARKLTHNVMTKEIKQVRVWEDLDFNANVCHKTKEFVKKYMSRVGPVYQIKDDNSLDPI